MTLAYPGEGTSSLSEQIAKDYFIASLGDRDLELKIREREPRDLESAFKHAVQLEAYDKAVVDDNREQYNGKSNRYRQDDGLSRKVAQLERKVTVEQPAARSAVTSVSGPQPQSTVQDSNVRDLKDNMARLPRQNDELSREVGRLRLLEEQRKGASPQPHAASVEAPAPPKASQGPDSTVLGMVDNVDKSVSDEDRRRLMSLLTEFFSAFSKDENDLGWTDVITHAIDTGDSNPVRQPLRTHPPAHMVAIQEHVSYMLQQGVIQPANSPWASNLVLVKEKDGSLRCCVD